MRVVAAEQPVQVLRVGEPFTDQERCVRVCLHVLPEVLLVAQNVVDHPAEEGDVGAGPQRDVLVGECARCAQPTAQYGQTEDTTRSATSVLGRSPADRGDSAALPLPSRSGPASCR